ncbi:Fur family transcriptional regulator [Sagittula sp. SSi028]|uniref:Fur family transcriptional regulator n=1 Tax=Sagittula sp. SSi028 TaxID=3400636 RepID=UPI003AF45BC6
MDIKGFETHDHAHCIHTGLKLAEDICKARGVQLTPVRRRVLEILLTEHRAMGAYEVLDVLRAEGLGSQPPVAYRALDFLSKNGLIHRVERLNAFVACSAPDKDHAPTFLICRSCSAIAETPAPRAARVVRNAAGDLGFDVERMVIEAEGLCPACKDAAA